MLNPHLSVWLSAVVFSAIHCQLDAFFPRLLLGLFVSPIVESQFMVPILHISSICSIVAFSFFFPPALLASSWILIGLHQPVNLFLSVVLTAASVLFFYCSIFVKVVTTVE